MLFIVALIAAVAAFFIYKNAKKYNIKTGEPIVSALTKCPNLQVYPPDYNLYMRCSNSMYELLLEYSI